MRSLALLLILANISLLFWQLKLLPWLPLHPEQFAPITNKSTPSTIAGLPSLMLLNEKLVENDPISEDKLADKPDIVKPFEKPIELENKLDNSIPDTIVTDIAGDNPQPTSIKITANNELKAPISTDLAAKTTKPIVKSEQPEQIDTCFQAGPYTSDSVANTAIDWLEEKDTNVVVNMQEKIEKKLIGTWVYLPPFETLEDAKRIRTYLDKVGIKDHHIVRGKLKNAISLGVYSVPTNAEIRVKELQAKGYNNVKIRKRYKETTNYWLNVKMFTKRDSLLNSFNKKFKDFALKSVICESINYDSSNLGKTTLLNE